MPNDYISDEQSGGLLRGSMGNAKKAKALRRKIKTRLDVGMTMKEIAAELRISIPTIYRHRHALGGVYKPSEPTFRCRHCLTLVTLPHECDPLLL